MKRYRNWIIALVISATAGAIALQNVTAPTQQDLISTQSQTSSLPSGNCAFMWATHDALELTKKVDAAIRALNEQASARANLFGEDCIYSDGQSTFSVMETDFYVQLPVDNLTDEEAFGNWMAQVLPLIVQIPKDEIQGNYGFVEFSFIKSDTERIIFRVPISTYISEAKEKSGTELFQFFYTPSN